MYRVSLCLSFLIALPAQSGQSFPLARIDGTFYTNVTVSQITKTDVYFSHSQGIASAKLSRLSPDLQRLLGNSLGTSQATSRATAVPVADQSKMRQLATMLLPYPVTSFDSAEKKEKDALSDKAKSLFTAKDYDGLAALANKYRQSKEQYANGSWKLRFLYSGLSLPEESSDQDWTAHLSAIKAWIKAKPESITPRVALADQLASYAWKARGSDHAYKVTDNGWRLFEQRLLEAAKVLEEAERLEEKCPHSWSIRLRTALGLGMKPRDHEHLLRDALREYPGYVPFYSDRAKYLLPRWYGKEGDWERDLEKSASQLGGQEGDLVYAQVVWSMHKTGFFTNIFKQNAISWPKVDKGFEAIENKFPDSFAAKSERAYLASLARDDAASRKYFDRLGGKADSEVWQDSDSYIKFALHVYTVTGPSTKR